MVLRERLLLLFELNPVLLCESNAVLAGRLGVASHSVSRAVRELRLEGRVRTVFGDGPFGVGRCVELVSGGL